MVAAAFDIESQILERVIRPENSDLAPVAARSLLKHRFSAADTKRMNQLAKKARDGVLSSEEGRLLQSYLLIGSLVDLLHSKARLSLKQSGATDGS